MNVDSGFDSRPWSGVLVSPEEDMKFHRRVAHRVSLLATLGSESSSSVPVVGLVGLIVAESGCQRGARQFHARVLGHRFRRNFVVRGVHVTVIS